eukprot:TRINITY_DN70106_c0_g1_i1.p1 TRINITY_DN70106_c0_g1~~TRINITY_DN70106_c0_g1_i1.p1  ORF type:complete len:181 (-),score=30.59 TRINITY_DN70106_c0_g1_i1:25-510(-)
MAASRFRRPFSASVLLSCWALATFSPNQILQVHRSTFVAPGTETRRRVAPLRATSGEEILLCAACGTDIADMSCYDGCKVQANPSGGMPMYIGRFSHTDGVEAAGEASLEDSFFPGCSWTLGICKSCGAHLGWYYESSKDAHFWGLLMNRLEKSHSCARDG